MPGLQCEVYRVVHLAAVPFAAGFGAADGDGSPVGVDAEFGVADLVKVNLLDRQPVDFGLTAAYAINQGRMPNLKAPDEGLTDFYFIEAKEPEAIQDLIVRLVKERIPKRFGWMFRIGDLVIQTENDYNRDVFNGDLGLIETINRIAQEKAVNFEGRQDTAQRYTALKKRLQSV